MHISSSYAKILGQKLFRTREFPRSGSKAKDVKEREKERKKEKEQKSVITMASYALQTPTRVAHASHLGQCLKSLKSKGKWKNIHFLIKGKTSK